MKELYWTLDVSACRSDRFVAGSKVYLIWTKIRTVYRFYSFVRIRAHVHTHIHVRCPSILFSVTFLKPVPVTALENEVREAGS